MPTPPLFALIQKQIRILVKGNLRILRKFISFVSLHVNTKTPPAVNFCAPQITKFTKEFECPPPAFVASPSSSRPQVHQALVLCTLPA